jgi:hypothetical protein
MHGLCVDRPTCFQQLLTTTMHDRSRCQCGNVAVTVAVALTLIVGVMAFALDTGFLITQKNNYQHAVAAAARAGALHLCDENPDSAARAVAIANDIPGSEAEGLTVQIGYYDEDDRYGDFSHYRDFVASGDSAFPDGEYNNAVMVLLEMESSGLSGMMPLSEGGDSTVTVRAAAVAYLRSYGMLALGEEAGDGIRFYDFTDGNPAIANGRMHASGDIVFTIDGGSGQPDIDADSVRVTAGGTISGYNGGETGVDPISFKPVSASLEDLRSRAYRILTDADFPAVSGDERVDEDGNRYQRIGAGGPWPTFSPFTGDHNGRIYYFESEGVDIQLANHTRYESGAEITNLTFVSETSVLWRSGNQANWGGINEKQLTIVAGKDINFGGNYHSDGGFSAKGVVLFAGGDIFWRNASMMGTATPTRTLRMLAGGSITIQGHGMVQPPVGFDLRFGPPCPPYDIRPGRLVTP